MPPMISLLADVSTKEWISGSGERVAAIFDATNGSRKGMKKGSAQDRKRMEKDAKASLKFGTQLMDRGGWRFAAATPFRYGDDVFRTAVAQLYGLLKTSPLYLALQRRRAARRDAD
jgi:hypothetical protein